MSSYGVVDTLFRELFTRQHGLTEPPIVAPAEIVHWSMVARALGLSDLPLHQQPTYVAAGYFYAIHTLAPTEDDVRIAIETASARAASTLFPAVRRDAANETLATAGFAALPWFFEAEYHVRTGVDEDLRAQLGSKRYRELRRLERHCDAQYRTTVLVGADLAAHPNAFEEFVQLHALNLSKYGHARNQYPASALRWLAASPLGARMVMLLRPPKDGGPAVQALLGFLEPDRRRILVPVHGIDHGRVPSHQNLYLTGFTALYRWGLTQGYDVFNLGRGAERKKLDLGANSFYVLDNHIDVAGLRSSDGLEELSVACSARMALGAQALVEATEHRGVRDLIRLPRVSYVVAA